MRARSFILVILILLCDRPDAAAQEVFASYSILNSQVIPRAGDLDLSLGVVDSFAPEFSLRYEYSYSQGSEQGDWYSYEGDAQTIQERKTILTKIHGFSLGGQRTIFANMIAWGSLLYSVAPGTIEVERMAMDGRQHSFSALSLHSQFGLGQRWALGKHCRIGVDWFVILTTLWEKLTVDDIDSLPQSQYAVKRELRAQVAALQEFRALRAVVTVEF